jgi:hypothetical protein
MGHHLTIHYDAYRMIATAISGQPSAVGPAGTMGEMSIAEKRRTTAAIAL